MRPMPFLRIAGMSRRVRSCVPTRLTSSCSLQQRRRQIFDGAGLAERRIIEQSRQTAARQFESSDRTRRDRLRVGEFETQRFDALVLLEPDKIIGVTRRRDDAPAALLHRSGSVEADARRASRNQNRTCHRALCFQISPARCISTLSPIRPAI